MTSYPSFGSRALFNFHPTGLFPGDVSVQQNKNREIRKVNQMHSLFKMARRFCVARFFVMGLVLGTATFTGRAAVLGNIDPLNIEIDASADLYPNSGVPGFVDWVKDSLPNSDAASLSNSIATGLIPNVTAAPGGSGHWYGARIVDGIAGDDQNIFLTGGKENDTTTWNIGPGTVGSSKYDITQAYLANNSTKLYFGMERRGNNGTTAFDFEFNRLAPTAALPLIPNRSVGDVLFSFEMNGSGSSGSATPHYFVWDGTQYAEQIPVPPSLVSSINNVVTPAAPWGFVNSKGNWALGNVDRFSFAEASVSLAETFPGLDLCNGARAFVQVRTRSSVSPTSDLKDTTKVFEYLFGGPDAELSLGTDCLAHFTFDGTASKDSSGGTNLTYTWDFVPSAGATLSGAGVTGPDGNGAYHSTLLAGTVDVSLAAGADSAPISVKLTVTQGTTCTSSKQASVTVLRPVSATAALSLNCLSQFGFDGTGSTAGAGVTYRWDFVPPAGVTLSGTGITGPDASGAYHSSALSGAAGVVLPVGVDQAAISAKLTVFRGNCSASAQQNTTVLRPLAATAALSLNCLSQFGFDGTGSTSGAGVGYTWDFVPPAGVTLSGAGITGPDAGGAYHSSATSGLASLGLPAGVDQAIVSVKLTVSRGTCSTSAQQNVTVLRELQASITQKASDGSTLSVTLGGSAPSATTLQWQRQAADGSWVNIAGATGSSLVYSSFEADSAAVVQSFNIDGTAFKGKLFQVPARLHAERVFAGVTCAADSAPVALKKVTAVDP